MRLKSELYKDEQEEIINKLINIVNLDNKNNNENNKIKSTKEKINKKSVKVETFINQNLNSF